MVGPDGGAPTVLLPGLWAKYAAPGHLLVAQPNGSITAVPFDLKTLRVTGDGEPIGHRGCRSASSDRPDTSRSPQPVASCTSRARKTIGLISSGSTGTAPSLRSIPAGLATLAPSRYHQMVAGLPPVSVQGGADEIRLRDLTTGARVRIAEQGVWLRSPEILPDSRTIVFYGINSEAAILYRATAGNGGAPEQLFRTRPEQLPIPSGVSPDGRTVFYTQRSPDRLRVFAHSLGQPDTPDRDLFSTQENASQAVPSPDGRWLAYLTDESGQTELSVRPADLSRAERWQVPRPGGAGTGTPSYPHWSRDSRELVYRSGTQMVSARIAPGASFAIAGQQVLFSAAHMAPSFDLFPNGDLLMIRNRPASESPMRLMMIDRWDSGLKPRK